jgi:replicative DNA helicase
MSTADAAAEVERAVLGTCLLEEEVSLSLACSLLTPDHFSLDSHQRIMRRIRELYLSQRPVSIVTIAAELDRHKERDAIGGVAYLAGLTEGIPRRMGEQVRDYCERVKEFWRLRQTAILHEEMARRASDGSETSDSLNQEAAARLGCIVADSADDSADISASIVATLDEFNRQRSLKQSPGIPYGVPSLDRLTGGMMPGLQTAVGALPGIGKTTFMCQAILGTLRAGYGVDAFLYEPSKNQVTMQIISLMLGTPYEYVTKPWTCPQDVADKVTHAAGELVEMPLRLHSEPGLNLDQQLGLARLAITRYDSRLICTDFVQRMKIKAQGGDDQLRLRIGRASRSLADLVKGTKAHSLLLSQIGTGRKGGPAAIPTMFDFRESGDIEQDARTILLLHREYDETNAHFGQNGAIFCAKQTFGSPGNVRIYFDPVTAAWTDPESTSKGYQQTWHEGEAVCARA